MSTHEEHVQHTFDLHGYRHEHIHLDLDEIFPEDGPAHRKRRHHLEYCLEKLNTGKWNIYEFRSALQHIIDDCGCIMFKEDWGE